MSQFCQFCQFSVSAAGRAIDCNKLFLDPNRSKYPDQKIFVVEVDEYVHLVPFIEDENEIFLKRIIPSRKMTKKYLGDKNESE